MPRHFWFAQLFQRLGGQKRWNASVRGMLLFVLLNIQDKLADRKSPHENKFGTPFGRPVKRVGQTLVVGRGPQWEKAGVLQPRPDSDGLP